MTTEQVYGAFFGVAIGDALGVPVEFSSRASFEQNPIVDFVGYKTHHQPPGTFSDDASLTFCLARSLCNGYNLADMADKFVQWKEKGYWTAHGNVFDIGMTTSRAIARLKKGTRPDLAGDFEEGNNGNGSLMRIIPLVFYVKDLDIHERYKIVREVSSITHAHIRSVMACFYYVEFALHLLQGKRKQEAYESVKGLYNFFVSQGIVQSELDLFHSLLQENIADRNIDRIASSGYVLHTLEASIWCLMTTNTYEQAVLKAVNLGSDTDTTGAVTGGLAGLYYGYTDIPQKWKKGIARAGDIVDLCELFLLSLNNSGN